MRAVLRSGHKVDASRPDCARGSRRQKEEIRETRTTDNGNERRKRAHWKYCCVTAGEIDFIGEGWEWHWILMKRFRKQ